MKSPTQRLQAAIPKLTTAIETAAITDQVLLVHMDRSGSVQRFEHIDRAPLAKSGDLRLAEPAPIKPGEYGAAWVFGHIEGVPEGHNPVVRAGLRPPGGKPWPPDDLEDLLRARTRSLMPGLSEAIRRASEADDVLLLIFTGSGVWSERHGLAPRAQLFAEGHAFCAERPSLQPGEVWACWALAVDRASRRSVAVRLSAVPETKGGDA
jgi:hypothetical protein